MEQYFNYAVDWDEFESLQYEEIRRYWRLDNRGVYATSLLELASILSMKIV
jgi:hypothetical protein